MKNPKFAIPDISIRFVEIIGIDWKELQNIEELRKNRNIILEVFDYSFQKVNSPPNKWYAPVLLYKSKGFLKSIISLDKITDSEYPNILYQAITTYKYIPYELVSNGVIPQPNDDKELFSFQCLSIYIYSIEKILKNKLFNDVNPIKSRKEKRKYYDGSIELCILELIKELFITAQSGNKHSEWMLDFSSPFHIWLIYQYQEVYLQSTNMFKRKSTRNQYEDLLKKKKKRSRLELIKILENTTENNFTIIEAVKYTIEKLVIDDNQKIKNCFYNYVDLLSKKMYSCAKTKNHKYIDDLFEFLINDVSITMINKYSK